MSEWLNSIILGIAIYGGLMAVFLPVGLVSMLKARSLNLVRFGVTQCFFLYMCCLLSVVFLPLPSYTEAANLTYQCQLIPFYFVYDIITKPCVSAVLGELFNILLFVPLGVLLTYYYKIELKKVLLIGFALTLFIEIAQLTGLFFLYHGSYRLFDVDDLIANTAGAVLGYLFMKKIEHRIPAMEHFDHVRVFRHIFFA